MPQKLKLQSRTSPLSSTATIIRPAIIQDAEGIARVQKLTWFATYPNAEYDITLADLELKDFDSPAAIAGKRQWVGGTDTSRTWVGESGATVVGFCSARRVLKVHEISALYVLPDFQGDGVGKRLMLTALEWLGTAEPVQVDAAVYNHRAIAFYQSLGFAVQGPSITTTGNLPNGKVMPEITLIKPAGV